MPSELIFLLTAAAVIVAGARLARDGDTIADRTGLGAGWVGAILVAGATSLPEITTDVAAVRQGESSLAIGDLFGSSMANMLILAGADLLTRGTRLTTAVPVSQAMVGVLAMLLTAVAAAGVLAGEGVRIAGIGWAPLIIGMGYLFGVRLIHTNRPRRDTDAERPGRERSPEGLRRPVVGFVVAAVVILTAAPYLARSSAELAEKWGIASGFFGMVFLAAATSLPEAAVVGAAIKAGAYTLAVGNLFGSNCFNMVVLLILDVADGAESLLPATEQGIVVGGVFAIVLTGQAVLDVLNRPERRTWYLEPGPGLILLTYTVGLFLTYSATHSPVR